MWQLDSATRHLNFNGMPHLGEHLHDGFSLPAEVNWITAVAVNPVKDQGHADLAGRFPPLAALRELGSSLLPSW